MSSNSEDFKIQPHPQDNHTNTPAGNVPNSAEAGATANPGPRILDDATASKLEAPKSKDELTQASASLNQDVSEPINGTQDFEAPTSATATQDDVPTDRKCCNCL